MGPRHASPLLLLVLPALARADPAATMREIAPVLVTSAVFGSATFIVAIVLFARNRTAHLRHETIRLALEKGQPVPADLIAPRVRRPDPARDLRLGLLLLGLGAGLGLFLFSMPESREAAGVGLIPGLMGLGFLVTWLVTRRSAAAPGLDA